MRLSPSFFWTSAVCALYSITLFSGINAVSTTTATTTLSTVTSEETSLTVSASATYVPVTTVSASTVVTVSSNTVVTSTSVTSTATAPTYTLDPDFSITTATTTRSYAWTLAQATGSPDGYEKIVYTLNGQMPGPLIEANEGDTIVVTVTNSLSEGASIHWHGMYQNGTADMDGVPGFSQCPIPAGDSFTYTFSTAGQFGTFWYHSHTSVQYSDGVLGPLIIHSPSDPYIRGTDFASEQVILLQDWYHNRSSVIAAALLTTAGYDGSTAAPPPQANLINGVGVFDCSDAGTGTCTTKDPPAITVDAEKIRFRVINGGSHAQQYVSVDLHLINVTGADATAVYGPSVERIPIHNGQRYDFIADFSDASSGDSYWLRSEINANCFAYQYTDLDATARLAIHIGTNNGTAPTSNDWSADLPTDCVDFPDSDLTPVIVKEAPLGLTVSNVRSFNSALGMLTTDDVEYSRFFMNSTSYINYIYQPFLATINNGSTISTTDVAWAEAADDEWAIDIIINNKDNGLDHPYHLHGADFYIVARGSGVLAEDDWASIDFNTTNPVRRDTLVIPGGDYAVLRIFSDIPGVWPLHCHIAWHLAQGFMGAVVIHPDTIKDDDSFPATSQAVCNAGLAQGYSVDTTEPGRKRSDISSPFKNPSLSRLMNRFDRKALRALPM